MTKHLCSVFFFFRVFVLAKQQSHATTMNANGRFSNLLLLLLRSRYRMCKNFIFDVHLFCDRFLSITRWLARSVILVYRLVQLPSDFSPVQSSQVHSTAHMCHHFMCGLLCTSSMVSITFSNWKHAWYSHGPSAVVVWQSAHVAGYELI